MGGAEDWKTKVSVVECGFFWGGGVGLCVCMWVCACVWINSQVSYVCVLFLVVYV